MRTLMSVLCALTLLRGANRTNSPVEALLASQVEAWNKGDIPAFVDYYAADCTFVGKEVLHGQAQLLARYRTHYASKAAMGQLTFRNLQVQALDGQVAVAYGEWHIERPSAAGGATGGVFSLVLKKQPAGWRIVLDHTT